MPERVARAERAGGSDDGDAVGESEAELRYDEYNRRSGNKDAAGENEGYLEAYE